MSASDDIAELRASFRAVLEDAASAGVVRRHVDEGASRCDALWDKAIELGWFALLTPEAHGGLELGRAAAAALYEELGRVTAPLPIAGALIATDIIATFGAEPEQAQWLPRLAAGEIGCFNADEITPEWNAVRYKDGHATGDARDLLDGAHAALLITPVRENTETHWALAEIASIARPSQELVDRTRGLAQVRLEAARAAVLPGEVGAVSRALLTHASIALACDSIGGAKAVLDLTVAYLKTREQFGKPIGSFQALTHRCAEHKVAIEAADALVADAVQRWHGDDAASELYALLAKSLACDVYAAVATDAVQLHGGIGFTWEHVCHLYLKRAKLNQALLGGGAGQRDRAARLMVA